MKIAFVNDTHLSSRTPSSRKDDYSISCLEKLKDIIESCIDRKCYCIVFGGDVFHLSSQPLSFLTEVQTILKLGVDRGVKFYAIAGSHDLPYCKMSWIKKTALGVIVSSGLISILKKETLCEEGKRLVDLVGSGVDDERAVRDPESPISIMVTHAFWDKNRDPSLDSHVLKEEDILKLNYDIYVLGHDHAEYEPLEINSRGKLVKVYRFGSISRGTSHVQNIARDPKFLILSISRMRIEEELVLVKCKPPDEIFEQRIFTKKSSLTQDIKEFMESLDTFSSERKSLKDVIDSMNLDIRIRTYIENLLLEKGILYE